ncbi:MAG: N-6 DNA methylase [Candidatus Zeuxoniibacter abyssi]|nr:MAG: N-6 DNA methylase [Candidatus Persebacteraceae bacterium AB1(2)]
MLREAYKKGGEIYGETFDKTDLDWVLNCPSKFVSRAVEMMMLLLSRFDFSTISGDILTGIYDRFLDRGQRKAMGEFYTPPSVARYIVRRLNIRQTDSVFDPACGSGTFLLEAFEHMTSGDIRSGRGDYRGREFILIEFACHSVQNYNVLRRI